jgi:hypothetical protein
MNDFSKQDQTLNELIAFSGSAFDSESILSYVFPRLRYLSDLCSPTLSSSQLDPLFALIRPFLIHHSADSRILSLRIYRYLSVNSDRFGLLQSLDIENYIIRSFEQTGKTDERVEAFRLVRRWLELSPKTIPKGICNSIVALCDTKGDEFHEFGISLLLELSLKSPLLIAWSGGMRSLISNILSNTCKNELREKIGLTLSDVLNEQEGRSALKGGLELDRLISVFTDTCSAEKDTELEEKMKTAQKTLVLLSRTWPGLIYLSFERYRILISVLAHPFKIEIKATVLDTLFEMLMIPIENTTEFSLLNHYLGSIIHALEENGLSTALHALVSGTNNKFILRKSDKLIKLLTNYSAILLPSNVSNPGLKIDSMYSDIISTSKAATYLDHAISYNFGESFYSFTSSDKQIVMLMHNKMEKSLENAQFFVMISKSVLTTDPQAWPWEILNLLFSKPNQFHSHPAQVSITTLLKVVLFYFLPSTQAFVKLPWVNSNLNKARVGRKLILFLCNSKEYKGLLTTSISDSFFTVHKDFIGEMVECVDEEIKSIEGKKRTNRILTENNMRKTMTREYFKWLGILVNSSVGRKALKSHNFPSKFFKIAGIPHLAPVLLSDLDFTAQTSQQFLLTCLQSSSKIIRIRALVKLQTLFCAGLLDLSWSIIPILSLIRKTTDSEIITNSLLVLEVITQHTDNLIHLIKAKPKNILKIDPERKLLMQFLASPLGLEYLMESNLLIEEIKRWDDEENLAFVKSIEKRKEDMISGLKETYGLRLKAPKEFCVNECEQLPWLINLPLYLCLQSNKSNFIVDTSIEMKTNEVHLVGFVEELGINAVEQEIATALMLGESFIDLVGNETDFPIWTLCPTLRPTIGKDGSFCTIDKNGVQFIFVHSQNSLMLCTIKYRICLQPYCFPIARPGKHLFGELARTAAGLQFLIDQGYIERYIQNLAGIHPAINKKAWMWAIGGVGAVDQGAEYICRLNTLEVLIEIARSSEILTLRGTSLEVLSYLSRSTICKAALEKLGCKCTNDSFLPSCILLPGIIQDPFASSSSILYEFDSCCRDLDKKLKTITLDDEENKICNYICSLGTVADSSLAELYLQQLKTDRPEKFQNLKVFKTVMLILSGFKFNLHTRRKIHSLFDKIN